MLNIIKGYFQQGKTGFQKKVQGNTLVSNSDEIHLDDLLFLITTFEQGVIENQTQLLILEYFKLGLEEKLFQHYLVRSKILLTSHLMMHEFQIGLHFAAIFLEIKFSFHYTQIQANDPKLLDADRGLWISVYVQQPYHQYLQKLAINIQVFQACKVQQYPFGGENNKLLDIQTKILWLFKISNMVNNGLGQMDILKVALVKYPKEFLLKEIVLVYWSDIMVYYIFLSKEILTLVDYYKHLPSNVSLQFYELYLQLLNIRNTVNDLYKFKAHFDRDNVIKQPKWFELNQPLHQDIEQYMILQRHEQARGKYFNTDRVETKEHKRTKVQSMSPVQGVQLDLEKLRSFNNNHPKEKIIQTHRPGRKYSYDEENEDHEIEQIKKAFQEDNLQKQINDKRDQKEDSVSQQQMSFQKTNQFD